MTDASYFAEKAARCRDLMGRAARALGHPNAAQEICREIAGRLARSAI